MADIQTLNGNLLLNTDPAAPATPLAIARTDAGLTSTSQALAQLSMFGAGTGNLQGVMAFSTANDGTSSAPLVERLRVHTNGFVGIGTSNPVVKLAVGGDGANVSATDVWVENNLHVQGGATVTAGGRGRLRVGTMWNDVGLYAEPTSTGVASDLVLGASSGKVRIGPNSGGQSLTVNGDLTTGANPLRFSSVWSGFPDNSTNQAEISNDTGTYKTLMIVGNRSAGLGRRVSIWDRLEVNGDSFLTGTASIGTTTPQRKLHVHSDNWYLGAEIHASGATAGFSFTDRETGRQFDNNGAGERWVLFSYGRVARLWTSGVGERLFVAPNGDLTACGNVTAQGAYLIANGAAGQQAYIGGDGFGGHMLVGSMNANQTFIRFHNMATGNPMTLQASDFQHVSDATLKTNIEPITDALSKVRKLRGVSFDWAPDKGPKGTRLGLIAQEVAKVTPEAVGKDATGTHSVSYATLVSVLIEAIKEMDAKMSMLDAKISKPGQRSNSAG